MFTPITPRYLSERIQSIRHLLSQHAKDLLTSVESSGMEQNTYASIILGLTEELAELEKLRIKQPNKSIEYRYTQVKMETIEEVLGIIETGLRNDCPIERPRSDAERFAYR
jgi:hypothetical protein